MKCYAAYAKDNDLRNLGSSGGAFPVISKSYLLNNSIIYASVYDEDLSVHFKRINSENELYETFQSKYIQSNSSGIFESVEKDLLDDNTVIFCGTTCQVNALKNYLNIKKIDDFNLCTIDFICHGVPPYEVFKRFLDEYFNHKKITDLNMRNKSIGWNWSSYSWKYIINNKETVAKISDIPYMNGFLSNVFLRPSCYNCKGKSNKKSDITLGDFWGITETNISLDWKNGISCVILNTSKGEKLFDSVKDNLMYEETNYELIANGNPALISSTERPITRDLFFKKFNKGQPVEEIVNTLKIDGFCKKSINKLYRTCISKKTKCKEFNKGDKKTIFEYKENCAGCMACASICSQKAIETVYDSEHFCYAVINNDLCINCGLCEKVCPQKN